MSKKELQICSNCGKGFKNLKNHIRLAGKPQPQELVDKRVAKLIGREGWNKGLTKENDGRLAQQALSLSEHYQENDVWNKGLTKETNEGVAKQADIMRGRTHTAEHNEKVAASKRGIPLSEEHKEKISLGGKRSWENTLDRDARIKASLSATGKHPNKSELELTGLLNRYFPNQWDYIGAGTKIINGKCPDFSHTSKNLLIEFQGCYFHRCPTHCPDSKHENTFSVKSELFKQKGYKTIEIWEHELKNVEQLISTVNNAVLLETSND